MKRSKLAPPPPPMPDKRWTARLIRKRGELLGVVWAPDIAAAEAAAVREFKLTDAQRKRLVLNER